MEAECRSEIFIVVANDEDQHFFWPLYQAAREGWSKGCEPRICRDCFNQVTATQPASTDPRTRAHLQYHGFGLKGGV